MRARQRSLTRILCKAFQVVSYTAVKVIFRLEPELVSSARNVVDPVRRIGHPQKIITWTNLNIGAGNFLSQDRGKIVQTEPVSATDVVDAARHLIGDCRQINAKRRVLIVDKIVFGLAPIWVMKRQAMERIFDDLAGHAHLAMAGRFAWSVRSREAQDRNIQPVVC